MQSYQSLFASLSEDAKKVQLRKNINFQNILFCKDKIVISYWGGENFYKKKNGELGSNNPDKFLIFDLKGNYLKTLNPGYTLSTCCYDKENNRIILKLNDDIQFAYLDLDGII